MAPALRRGSIRKVEGYLFKKTVEYRRACLTAGGYPASSSEQTASAWPDQDCAHSPCVNRQIARDRSGMLFRVAVDCMVPAPGNGSLPHAILIHPIDEPMKVLPRLFWRSSHVGS